MEACYLQSLCTDRATKSFSIDSHRDGAMMALQQAGKESMRLDITEQE